MYANHYIIIRLENILARTAIQYFLIYRVLYHIHIPSISSEYFSLINTYYLVFIMFFIAISRRVVMQHEKTFKTFQKSIRNSTYFCIIKYLW